MAFVSFVNRPKSYLQTHEMALNGGGANLIPAGVTRGAPVVNPAHSHSVQYTHAGNVQLVRGGGGTNVFASAARRVRIMGRRALTYTYQTGGPVPGFRVLPWEGTNVTFMELDGAATFAVTGPLTGCTVSVVRHPGTGNVWFFHANVAGGGGVLMLATKRLMIQNAAGLVGIGAGAAYHYCEMGIGLQYQGQSFAWGRLRPNGHWKFYVHDVNPPAAGVGAGANQVSNVKWAEL